ncbi:MAG TPA: glycine cleavage system protein GcvH [Armatimonadota bacterium]|jgi:glycine cleavage system H protein|nr:glycine cleavage system protein GcvH [Armatimonadota bacterium]
MYPDDLKYHEGHAWVREDGDEVTIGISQYATDEMGEIIFAELPEVGTELERDEPYGSVESAKAVEDLIAPVDGEVTGVNDDAGDAPETINEDPYGEGWLITVKLAEDSGLDSLLPPGEYKAHIGESDDEDEDGDDDDAAVLDDEG